MRSSFASFCLLFCLAASGQKYYLFIGTYTGTGSKGIYVYQFDASTGKAKWVSNTDSVVNPSYLAVASGDTLLYACTETRTVNAGGVTAFKFNRSTGRLTQFNKQSSGGDNPAYVSVSKSGRWVIAGNYSGGSLAAFPVNKDGSLQPYSQLIQHEGKGANKERQEKAHVHSTVFSPAQDYLFVPDLGLDKVMIYRFNPAQTKPLQPAAMPYAATTPGSGPRHFDFHPNGKWAYLVEEMAGAVVAYQYTNGKLTELQRIFSHPDTLSSQPGSADVHVSPDGKFLYASNRGKENNIAIFKIDDKTGKLTLKGFQSTLGETPRNFCIEPSGKYLLAANQETDNIVVFKRDAKTGMLTYTGEQIKLPKPVCLKMIKF
ncbi:lactonase family protein [Flavisolibacter ginsenosidimutans]|uniref:Lactonase family protein n=1 Tax=Flavisolibacter ginsenosidimutans TaxID=661481 RepID=A0A5B8UDE6_9BACT|nr:lactonase family protein [Flavisolibacter ginsenosidimutans]QEC54513.1 lactonase family protein [Flavisolibacter ginsenosidimutans]